MAEITPQKTARTRTRRPRFYTLYVGGALGVALLAATVGAETDTAERTRASVEATKTLLKTLGSTLKKEVAEGGPAAAITVCRDVAPDIANDLSLKYGWKVSRIGTRVRNPMIGTSDPWEQEVLKQFAERAASGEPLADMTHSEIVTEPNGQYFRFVKAIGVQDLCLTCHGGSGDIPAEVNDVLNESYPHDKAVGYAVGDLRGAVSIKQPIE